MKFLFNTVCLHWAVTLLAFLSWKALISHAFTPTTVHPVLASTSSHTTTLHTTVAPTFLHDSKSPFAVIVQAEIDPDHMGEFLKMIETNAVETRKEPGCLRFDVLRSQNNPTQFFFYELYKNESDLDYHKQQPHFAAWASFKERGGTISSVSYKTDGEFLT